MSKVFRIYKGGADTLEGWQATPAYPYSSTARDTIDDPDGAAATHEITSIPSPLARIDLVKTAFAEVVKGGVEGLDGHCIYHKMVSDTLDVAEIFYNINKLSDKVEIIKWTPGGMTERLTGSPSAGHRYLADAMAKYLAADASTYNFDRLQGIYLINYPTGPDELNIIGATSPATLFFSNANDLTYVKDIYLGQRLPFNRSEFVALHRRDHGMIRYMMALRHAIPGFSRLFPEVDSYLTLTYKALTDDSLKAEIRDMSSSTIESDYSVIEISGESGRDVVEILGHELPTRKGACSLESSQMAIDSRLPGDSRPLVLPIEPGNRYSTLRYASAPWGNSHAAPIADPEPDIDKRVLPFDGTRYPYLTISDLLEDYVISVPHTLNASRFFDGNTGKLHCGELAYLTPIKPLFFKFFTINDLINTPAGRASMLTMEPLAGGALKVILRIPIKGNNRVNNIEYTRIYYPNRRPNCDKNEGAIISVPFAGMMMPPVKVSDHTRSVYNVSCVCAHNATVDLRFYAGEREVKPTSVTTRDRQREHNITATSYLLEGNDWDYMEVVTDTPGVKGLLIPIWQPETASHKIDFAVDLGTSNTHIEVRTDNASVSTPLEYDLNSSPVATFFTPTLDRDGAMLDLQDETALMQKDLLPERLGKEDLAFPTRTVLSSPKQTRWSNDIAPMTIVNLPFTYDKRRPLPYNEFHTDIKWGTGNALDIMEAYVNTLMLIMRNKALADGADLRLTRLTWFYPASMPPKRLQRLRRVWDDSFHRYFNPDGTTTAISESQAPANYFYRMISTATSMVNIDIGGGTTDIAYSTDGKVKTFTSFRMGANSLFEDPFSDISNANAIVDRHKKEILEILRKMNLTELIHIFNSPANLRPANMASFLFGLHENAIALEAGIKPAALDFNFRLREDEDFKLVFILFYASIIYHVGHIIAACKLELPRHISFSGNGSKILGIITSDITLLTQLTRVMLELSSGMTYGDRNLDLLGLDAGCSPKEATCKGGIMNNESGTASAPRQVVLLNGTPVSSDDTYSSMTAQRRQSVVNDTIDFIKFIGRVNVIINLDDNFGVSSRSLALLEQKSLQADLETFVDKGLKAQLIDSDLNDTLRESPFFYPIKGLINTISTTIGKKQ